MKKLVLLAVLALFSISASAQIDEGIRVGVSGGLSLSNVTGTNAYGNLDAKIAIGYNAALVFDYNFTENFHLETSLGLLSKGARDMANGSYDGQFVGNYLSLPIHVGYRFRLGGNSYFNIQAGPELACGLWGSTFEWSDGSGEFKYFDKGWAKRFEFGIGAKTGFEFSKFQVNFGTTYGLTKWAENTDFHTLAFYIGVAYMF